MRGLWKGFWQISKTDRIGYLLLFALLGLHLSIDAWGPRPLLLTHEIVASQPQKLLLEADTLVPASHEKTFQLFPFNINTATAQELERLGLSEKSIAGLMRFRSKGGQVRNEADFEKLFSIGTADKERLRPWLRWSDAERASLESTEKSSGPSKETSKVFVRVDLNQADSVQLLAVPGIGPAFASRIIRYRERLGGYMRIEQLLEVFGIDSAKYEALWPLLEVKSSTLRRVQPCEASEEELAAHPYVGKVLARRWAAYRLQRGCKGCTDMQKLAGLEAERWEKLLPYLDCAGLQ